MKSSRHRKSTIEAPEMLRRALPSCLLAAACLFAQATDPGPAKRWWAHVQYLADDKLEGRNTGSEGYRKAAEYVAAKFKEYGLQPAGVEGYFQPVKFEGQRVIAAQSRLSLKSAGSETPAQ